MTDHTWIPAAAQKTLNRVMPRMEQYYAEAIAEKPDDWDAFRTRLEREWERLFALLFQIYGWQYDFFYTLEQIIDMLIRSWLERPDDLRQLDAKREADPDWFLSQEMVGGVLYVDLFSDNLARLKEHIPYFRRLGLTYLHLMPLFLMPHGDNDGGYAVSDYRSVHPDLGTMEELAELARILHEEGTSLVLDFVFNHTSEDHAWARLAKEGHPDFQEFYLTFKDRTAPDQYQKHLRDIFPDLRQGSFTWNAEMQRWVWTTFNDFQWDLNYANPEVFRAMASEMLFLANQGVEILRLDAVAFIWKRLGTNCENLPQAHWIIQAFNAMARIVTPALLFKSEAIVHPDEVLTYVDRDECQLSYNPLLMALIWEALATRDVRLLTRSMQHRSRIPLDCSWVNYLRCHDDIGWTFDDDDARQLGIDPAAHRRFLNEFYTGEFEGTFASGVPFQYNPETGDRRISGTLASLAGLEKALESRDDHAIAMAVARINMLRSIMLSVGGIPLIYLGDEWGQMNDYTYLEDPTKVNDSRWVHRSRKRWQSHEGLANQGTLEWRFYSEMVRLIKSRQRTPAFRNGAMEVFDTGNRHVFGFVRGHKTQRVWVINNFSEHPQTLPASDLGSWGLPKTNTDLVSGQTIRVRDKLILKPYQFMWLTRE